ncbi:MAG: hypothetical protein K8I60_15885 [Anaerolineae bacterium]|nr:hypothetical protein [Anaerolineae bacterium]
MSESDVLLFYGLIVLIFIGLGLRVRHVIRMNNAAFKWAQKLRDDRQTVLALYPWSGKFQLEQPGYPVRWRWRQGVIVITQAAITFYPRRLKMDQRIDFAPGRLRWFGRPVKYTPGINEIWLHFEQEDGWQLLKIRLYKDDMRALVRALKAVVTPELVTAYRRQRPYVHAGPVIAQPATQDLQGAWHLDEEVTLYLMPLYLVILHGTAVLRLIPLEAMAEIGALRRLDQPGAAGLVRFRAEEETLAFALRHYDSFAASLAQAARLTLEDPLERKQKKADGDSYEWDE